MTIFGRSLARYGVALRQLPRHVRALWHACVVFRRPMTVILAYLRRRAPRDNQVRLRHGGVIHLSDDPADIITTFLLFAHREYGAIPARSSVVDVGANIGLFSLYAAWAGAAEVRAYEPSTDSFAALQRNIAANHLESIVRAEHCAVVGAASGPVKFRRRSSVHNRARPEDPLSHDVVLVPAKTLSAIVQERPSVDLLKLDCEGAEYDILLKTPRGDVRKAADIRMEFHAGPREALLEKLRADGFSRREFVDLGTRGGYVRLVRERDDPSPTSHTPPA